MTQEDWDYYYMAIARQVALLSGCRGIEVGAVLVRDCIVIGKGSNVPPNPPTCIKQGYCYPGLSKCTDSREKPSRAIHAEVNAIASATFQGKDTRGATLYVTLLPCLSCLKVAIAFGIERVCFGAFPYHATLGQLPKEYGLFTDVIKLEYLP